MRWDAITNDVLKFRKTIKFESLRIVIGFSCICLIIDKKTEKYQLSIKKVVKNIQVNQRSNRWTQVPIVVSSCTAFNPYVQVIFLNYSPFSNL